MYLEDYLKRIKFDGPLDTDHETLKKICLLHMKNVPFHNFDMVGGPRKVLDMKRIYNDIVVKGYGGFCHDLNGLFLWLLTKIGFKVEYLRAHVCGDWNNPESFNFTHLALLVTCKDDSQWIADVGFGGSCYLGPLKFVENVEQAKPNGVYRLRRFNQSDEHYVVDVHIKECGKGKAQVPEDNADRSKSSWRSMYIFDTKPQTWESVQPMCDNVWDDLNGFLNQNTISSFHVEGGIFLTWGLTLCRKKFLDPDKEEITEVKVLKDSEEFKKVIKEELGIDIEFDIQPKGRGFAAIKAE